MSKIPQQAPYNVPHMQQPPQYATPYAPPQQFPQDKPLEQERFKPKKTVNDPIFLVFFVLQFLAFTGLSGYVLNSYVSSRGLGGGLGKAGSSSGSSVTLNRGTVYLLLLVSAASLLLSTIYFMLIRAFTRAIMHVTLILSICLNIGICVYYWITKYYSGAIIFTIIAVLSVLAYWGFRRRIPLAALLLQVTMDVAKHHTSVYVVAFTSLLLQAALNVWVIFTAIAIYTKWTPGNPSCGAPTNGSSCSSGKVAGLLFFTLFFFFWTSQVIANVALATMAGGPFGCWYYFGPKYAGEMPKHPTISALGRACTTSLGSIAFGSLIVTLLDLLRVLFDLIRNMASEDGNPVLAILACCASCFIACIQGLVEYFNRYAYIEIALYGKAYIPAAKDTWRLLKDRGIDALVNDSLVSMTMTWGAYVVGLVSSLFAYIYLRYASPDYNAEGQYTAPILLIAFLVGLQCSLTLSSAIEAGVSTIFVGLGEDPQVLAIRAPQLFQLIAEHYPQVVEGVPRP